MDNDDDGQTHSNDNTSHDPFSQVNKKKESGGYI